ncbi:MAG: hypothetical protein WCT28_03290 [Patescibacteria group bacterium]|jgi:hypothetical protein
MPKLFVIFFLSFFLSAPTIAEGKTPSSSKSLRTIAEEYGEILIEPAKDQIAAAALKNQGVQAFVRITETGYEVYFCRGQGNLPRICTTKIVGQVNDQKKRAEALLKTLNKMSLLWLSMEASDTVTINALQPFCFEHKLNNGDQPLDGKFSIRILRRFEEGDDEEH